MSLTLDVLKAISLGLSAGAIKAPDIEMMFSPGKGGPQRVTLLSMVEDAIAETQRFSNANGSDEQTSPSVQPPAPEPDAWANSDEIDNMLDDRTATVAGKPDGWRKTPLYRATPSIAQRGAALTDTWINTAMKVNLPKYMRDTDGGREALCSFARAIEAEVRALSPERPDPPAPSTTGEKP